MTDEPTRRQRRMRPRLWTLLPAAAIAGTAATVLVVAQVSNSPAAHRTHLPALLVRPAAQLLTPYSSCGSLLDGLRSHASTHLDAFAGYGSEASYGLGGAAAGAAVPAMANDSATSASGSAATGPQTSTTNVQEAGVDEPDIVKTDGDRVVTVAGSRLRVVDAATRSIAGTLDLRSYANADTAQLLTSDDHAIVLLKPGTTNFGRPIAAGGVATSGPVRGGRPDSGTNSTLLYIELSPTPRVTGSLVVTGDILDARMVGSTVRVVASNAPSIVQPQTYTSDSQYKSDLRASIGKTALTSWLPSYTVTGPAGTHKASVPCSSVDHPKDFTAASMLTVYTVDPGQPGADPRPVSIAADGNTVYATATSLYVTSSPSCLWCFGANGRTGATQIHRFDITGTGAPTYLGSGSVQGSLLSQYSLSDYAGSLRVATTVVDSHGVSVSGVDVLDATTLAQTGSVSGLGKGERVYAVRFLGKLGYVVTYNQQDPLYVLDLSNANAPHLVGSLEISGFSSYLHDAGNGRLIGVGQDTTLVDEAGGQYAHNEGRMVQLFDVSDPSKPARTAKVVLPGTGTPGDPSFDRHAFLYWQPTGLVVVPIANYGPAGALAVRLSGKTLVKVGTVTGPGSDSSGQTSPIERGMIVDGNLWTFSASGIQVSNQSDLAPVAWIGFA